MYIDIKQYNTITDIVSIKDDECSICYEILNNKKPLSLLSCGHVYHHACIFDIRITNNECADCRKTITDYKSFVYNLKTGAYMLLPLPPHQFDYNFIQKLCDDLYIFIINCKQIDFIGGAAPYNTLHNTNPTTLQSYYFSAHSDTVYDFISFINDNNTKEMDVYMKIHNVTAPPWANFLVKLCIRKVSDGDGDAKYNIGIYNNNLPIAWIFNPDNIKMYTGYKKYRYSDIIIKLLSTPNATLNFQIDERNDVQVYSQFNVNNVQKQTNGYLLVELNCTDVQLLETLNIKSFKINVIIV